MALGIDNLLGSSSSGKILHGRVWFPSFQNPPPGVFLFSFYTGALSPFLYPRVDFTFWGAGLSRRPIPRVVGSCWKGAWAWAWACQTPNFVLLCWLLFPWPCPYTHFVPLFGHLVKCRGEGRPRQWLSSAWAADLKINWAWTGLHFLWPHSYSHKLFYKLFYKLLI